MSFAGTPKAAFTYIEGFSFLNESRKAQMTRLLKMQQITKMGSITDMLKMIPGVGSKLSGVNIDEDKVQKEQRKNCAIIQSMTKMERRNPDILNASRRRRIAAGSGTTVQEVNLLLKQYEQARQMMKTMMGGGRKGRMRFPFKGFN